MIRGWSIQDGRTDADQAWITVSNSWRTRGDDQRILSLPIDASIQAMSVFPPTSDVDPRGFDARKVQTETFLDWTNVKLFWQNWSRFQPLKPIRIQHPHVRPRAT
jgi:hypothetical protein